MSNSVAMNGGTGKDKALEYQAGFGTFFLTGKKLAAWFVGVMDCWDSRFCVMYGR